MNEQEALAKMVAPGTPRPGKYRNGVIQIHVTRSCNESCYGCTQGSNLAGKTTFITPEQFEQAVLSLKDYWGVVGMFGGNPALHTQFEELCAILVAHVPFEQRGIWCNHPVNAARTKVMRTTFNPAVSNLNVHLNQQAWDLFTRHWPEARPFGLKQDSRHSPCYVALKDVESDEDKRWELISDCDINKHWSAMIGVFRGELRAWFCEIAGAQAILHQDESDYPDTGIPLNMRFGQDWWKQPMGKFALQVRKHCHECGVPLRGHGELAQAKEGKEQVSVTHETIFKPRRQGRAVELVTLPAQLGAPLDNMTRYLQNAKG